MKANSQLQVSVLRDAHGFNLCGPEDDITVATPFDWPTPSEPPWALHYGPHQIDMAMHVTGRVQRRFRPKGKR